MSLNLDLFKFNLEWVDKDEEENEEKIMSEFAEKLRSYELFTFDQESTINY